MDEGNVPSHSCVRTMSQALPETASGFHLISFIGAILLVNVHDSNGTTIPNRKPNRRNDWVSYELGQFCGPPTQE